MNTYFNTVEFFYSLICFISLCAFQTVENLSFLYNMAASFAEHSLLFLFLFQAFCTLGHLSLLSCLTSNLQKTIILLISYKEIEYLEGISLNSLAITLAFVKVPPCSK